MISLAELRFLIDDEQNFQLISILSKILPCNIKQQTIIKKKRENNLESFTNLEIS